MNVHAQESVGAGGVRTMAGLISVIFHPLCLGVLMAFYLIYLHPGYFVAVGEKRKLFTLISFAVNNFLFPVLVVFLLRGLGFINSIYLRTQKERIVPYIAVVTFFFWTWYVFRNQPDIPEVLTEMCQGIFFAACCSLVCNAFFKISMHAVGVGGLLGLILVVLYAGQLESATPLLSAIFLSGLVCTARLLVSDHTRAELIVGFCVGLVCQFVSHGA